VPKVKPKGVADGKLVNIPVLGMLSEVMTEKAMCSLALVDQVQASG
jgi:hypothetical protein